MRPVQESHLRPIWEAALLNLLVALVAAAGVLVPLAAVDWDPDTIDTGFWFAVAVPVLGLLGALKALLTGPRWR